MHKKNDYTWPKKDIWIVSVCMVVIILQITVHVCNNGLSSIGELIEQVILVMLAFVGLLEIFHYVGWDIFVPEFMLKREKHERMEELQKCVDEVVTQSMKVVVAQSIDAYLGREANFIQDFAEEKIDYILSQLGITAKQFERIRIELIKMRCLPLVNLDDAAAKIKQFIRAKEPLVTDLGKIDSSKCTYSRVQYYLNFNDAMFFSSISRELVSIMHLLISEKMDLAGFDKIVIPSDSNFVLGLEVGKLLGKPVVHIRHDKGRIEKEKCWDGKLSPTDRVVIVHDVLVTSDQIIHTLNKLPKSCQVMGVCCLVVRKEWDGVAKLNSRQIKVERVLDLNDEDIYASM